MNLKTIIKDNINSTNKYATLKPVNEQNKKYVLETNQLGKDVLIDFIYNESNLTNIEDMLRIEIR